jgi:hypothetical protein
MRKHMLTYHVGVPLAVIAVLLLVGIPAANAVSAGVAAGCLSMVLMMFTGHGHRRHHHPSPRVASTDAGSTQQR